MRSSFKPFAFSSADNDSGKSCGSVGINDLARVGIEATLWPCEGSTRQEWLLSDAGKLQVFGHDWLGASTSSCLGRSADVGLGGLMLTTCNATEGSPGIYEVVRIPDQQKVQIKLKNKKVNSKLTCLVVQPLRNNGGKSRIKHAYASATLIYRSRS